MTKTNTHVHPLLEESLELDMPTTTGDEIIFDVPELAAQPEENAARAGAITAVHWMDADELALSCSCPAFSPESPGLACLPRHYQSHSSLSL